MPSLKTLALMAIGFPVWLNAAWTEPQTVQEEFKVILLDVQIIDSLTLPAEGTSAPKVALGTMALKQGTTHLVAVAFSEDAWPVSYEKHGETLHCRSFNEFLKAVFPDGASHGKPLAFKLMMIRCRYSKTYEGDRLVPGSTHVLAGEIRIRDEDSPKP